MSHELEVGAAPRLVNCLCLTFDRRSIGLQPVGVCLGTRYVDELKLYATADRA